MCSYKTHNPLCPDGYFTFALFMFPLNPPSCTYMMHHSTVPGKFDLSYLDIYTYKCTDIHAFSRKSGRDKEKGRGKRNNATYTSL